MIDGIVFVALWLFVLVFIISRSAKLRKERPGAAGHPTTINKSAGRQGNINKLPEKALLQRRTVASDGHRIPPSKDVTCEGQYGHDHGNMPPRYVVHEEPTLGYCNLNGKIVALKDCWKY